MAQVDTGAARAFLAQRFGPRIADVEHIGAGAWSRAFGFRWDGSDQVIRFGAHREDFDKDGLASRWASQTLPIPRVVEIGEGLGGFHAISERVRGTYIDDADEGQMRALLPSLFAALDAARLTDISETDGFGGWAADGCAPFASWPEFLLSAVEDRPTSRINGWRARLEASPVGAAPFDEAVDRLRSLVAGLPETRSVIHSDLLNRNVLVDADRVTGVLDWGCSLYGDFLYDLAWLCFWRPWYPAWLQIDFREEAERHYAAIGLDVPSFEQRLQCCMVHIGLDGQAYMAHTGAREDLKRTSARTLAVACDPSRGLTAT